MTDDVPWPPQICPRRPMPDPAPYRIITRYGIEQIIHPGICGICWASRHDDRPHHAFEPATAAPFFARQMGWRF